MAKLHVVGVYCRIMLVALHCCRYRPNGNIADSVEHRIIVFFPAAAPVCRQTFYSAAKREQKFVGLL